MIQQWRLNMKTELVFNRASQLNMQAFWKWDFRLVTTISYKKMVLRALWADRRIVRRVLRVDRQILWVYRRVLWVVRRMERQVLRVKRRVLRVDKWVLKVEEDYYYE